MSARTDTSGETVKMPRAIAEELAQFANEWDRWQARGSTSTEQMLTFSYGQARIGLPDFRAVRAMLAAAPATADTEDVAWLSISGNTAWIDGREVVILAHGMEVSARYCPGGPVQCGLEVVEYEGAVWSCFDDQFQFEIEEISNDPALWHHGPVTHWRDPSARPAPPPGQVS